MSVLDIDAVGCFFCNEYKGVMPLNLDTLVYLDEDPAEWIEYLN